MNIIYKTGNLLDATEPAIVHGCNAQGAMGSGVAKAIRATYPTAYSDYRRKFLASGLAMGEIIIVDCGKHVVINAITQEHYGSEQKRYVDYDAVRTAMRSINTAMKDEDFAAVAMPLIGAGLGGGQWPVIAAIIEEELTDIQPVIYTLDGKVPT